MQESTSAIKALSFHESWDAIVQSSRAMRELATENDWEALNRLAVERHRRITEHFRLFPVAPERAEFYHRHLADFLAEEKNLQQLAQAARESVMRNSIKANSNRKAVSAYRGGR